MPKPNLDDVLGINDPMLNDNFDFTITGIPGGGDTRALRLQCRSTSKPGVSIQPVEIELFGHKVLHSARKTFSHSLSVSFVETYEGKITTTLEEWAQKCRATETQHGEFKSGYTANGQIKIYDQTGADSLTYDIFNLFPTEVPELQFEGSGGANITNDATFAYDYYKRA